MSITKTCDDKLEYLQILLFVLGFRTSKDNEIAVYIFDKANDDKIINIDYRNSSAELHCSNSAIRNVVARLVDAKYIVKTDGGKGKFLISDEFFNLNSIKIEYLEHKNKRDSQKKVYPDNNVVGQLNFDDCFNDINTKDLEKILLNILVKKATKIMHNKEKLRKH